MLFVILERIKTDGSYRIKLFLCISFVWNIVFAGFLFIVGCLSLSRWFLTMSVYYGLLASTRIFCFMQTSGEKSFLSKIKTMRACGYFLLLINAVISVMIFILLYGNRYVRHHEITVITLAAYTFSALTVAIVGSVKQVRKRDYVSSSIKLISLVSASVSMVTLTNTMLSTFGGDNTLLRSIILPALSGVVSVFIISCAVIMIYQASRALKDEPKRK